MTALSASRLRRVAPWALDDDDLLLLRPLLAGGALLAVQAILLPDAEVRAMHLGPAAAGAIGWAGAGVAILLAALGPRWLPRSGANNPRYEMRFAGLSLVYAGLALAIAAYARLPWLAIALQASAAIFAGLGLAPLRAQLGKRVSSPAAAIAGVGLAGAGALLAVFGPPLISAISDYAGLRTWRLSRPDTTGAAQAAVLVGVVAGVVGADMLGRVGRALSGSAAMREGIADVAEVRRPQPQAELQRKHPEALLEVMELDVIYGQVQVLFDVAIHVDPGEAVALLGTNGAGKSTLLRAAFGLKPPARGRVWFDGADVTGAPAERLMRRGMVQVPGGRGIFPSLTVAENLRLAGYAGTEERRREGTDRTLGAFPRLAERLHQPAGVLSGGEQQMLALGRAWIARPRLLAIDELTLGLAPTVIDTLMDFAMSLTREGIALVVVEQSVEVALELAARAYFLERGTVRFEGRTEDLLRRDDLVRSIFFAPAGQPAPPARR